MVFGLPRTVIITSSEVTEAIKPSSIQIIGAVKGVLEDTPPELAADIIDKGIVMSGGTSILRNFDKLMTRKPVFRLIQLTSRFFVLSAGPVWFWKILSFGKEA